MADLYVDEFDRITVTLEESFEFDVKDGEVTLDEKDQNGNPMGFRLDKIKGPCYGSREVCFYKKIRGSNLYSLVTLKFPNESSCAEFTKNFKDAMNTYKPTKLGLKPPVGPG